MEKKFFKIAYIKLFRETWLQKNGHMSSGKQSVYHLRAKEIRLISWINTTHVRLSFRGRNDNRNN